MTLTQALVSIGEVSRQTGVSITALRYYDEIDLVSPTTRVNGSRRFDETAIGRVNFVVRAKEAGFALHDIKEMLDDDAGVWPEIVERRLQELRTRRDRLDLMIEMIEELRSCGCEAVATCPRMTA